MAARPLELALLARAAPSAAAQTAREQGRFRRVRVTPLPTPIFIGSWIASTVLAALASVTARLWRRMTREHTV